MRALRLAALLLFVLCSAFAGQDPTGAPPVLRCPACEGAGHLDNDCWVCRGAGEHACITCKSYRVARPARGAGDWVPAAALAELQRSLADALKALKRELPPLPAGKKAPKHVQLKPGERRCPAGCRGGEHLLIDDWIDCKVCKSGKFDCGSCRRGEQRCGHCAGRGRAVVACDDCAGTGSLPDARGLAAAVCPWCFGTNARACGTCDSDARVPAERATCLDCLDLRHVPCETCQGYGRLPCARCKGRGRHGPQKLKCTTCDGAGVSDCDRCDDGAAVCASCAGAREHPCNGCAAGAYAAWERTAELALASGDAARAAALLAAAHERCARRYAAAHAQFADVKDEASRKRIARAIDKERDDELHRLAELRRAAAQAGTRAAGG
jgi:hypothetical protein